MILPRGGSEVIAEHKSPEHGVCAQDCVLVRVVGWQHKKMETVIKNFLKCSKRQTNGAKERRQWSLICASRRLKNEI